MRKSLKVEAVVDVVADIGIVGIQSAVGAVAKPIRIVKISGLVLAEDDFPQSGMEVGIDGVQDWLLRCVGGRKALVMGVLVLMENDMGDRSKEIRCFKTRKSNGVIPDDETIPIGGEVAGEDAI